MSDNPYPLPKSYRESDILSGDGRSPATYGPFDFKVFDVSDVVVMRRATGGNELFAEDEAATVTKTAGLAQDTFSVTFATAITSAVEFYVASRRLHERTGSVTRGGAVHSTPLERELALLSQVAQELRRDVDRAVSVDPDQSLIRIRMPEDAGRFLVTDGNGNLVDGGSAEDIAGAQENAAIAAAAAEQAEEALTGIQSAIVYATVKSNTFVPGRDYSLPAGYGAGTAAAINAAMATVAARGGGTVILPAETILLDGQIDNKYERVLVQGAAPARRANVNGGTPTNFGCVLQADPAFPLATPMARHRSPALGEAGAPGHKFFGGGFEHIAFNGNNRAGRALEVFQIDGGLYDCYIEGCVPGGYAAGNRYATAFIGGRNGIDLADSNCAVQKMLRCRVEIRQFGGDNGNVGLVLFSALADANVSMNEWIDITGICENGDGLRLRSADRNRIHIRVFRVGSGTGNLIYAHGDGNGLPVGGNQNDFISVSGNCPIYAEGTDVSGVTRAASNIIRCLDVGNGTPFPTGGTGALWQSHTADGLMLNPVQRRTYMTDSLARPTDGALPFYGTGDLTETLHVHHSLGVVAVFRGAQTGHIWRMRIDPSTGELIVEPLSGAKSVRYENLTLFDLNGPLKVRSNVGFYNTAPVAKQTVSGSRGGNAALQSLLTALAATGLITDSTGA